MGRAALSLKQKNPHFRTLAISSFHHVKIIAFVWQHESQSLETFNRGKKEALQRGYTVNTHNFHENAQACSIVMWIFFSIYI